MVSTCAIEGVERLKCRNQNANNIQGGSLGGRPDRVRSPLMQARSAGTSEALVFESRLKHFKVQILFSFAQNV